MIEATCDASKARTLNHGTSYGGSILETVADRAELTSTYQEGAGFTSDNASLMIRPPCCCLSSTGWLAQERTEGRGPGARTFPPEGRVGDQQWGSTQAV